MKINLLLTFFYLSFTNTIFAQWQTVYNSPTLKFTSVHFINNDTGFVAGYFYGNGNANGTSNYGTVFRTMNGGQTWDTTAMGFHFYAIQFVNDSIGFAAGQDGFIFKTTNMGNTWNYAGQLVMSDLSSLFFLNPQIGYASAFDGTIGQTTNGGANWLPHFPSLGRSYFPGTAKFVFTDSLIGYCAHGHHGFSIASQRGTVSKTSDGGSTWVDLPIPTNFFPYSCYFFDSLSGFAVGYHGKVSKTNDGGLSWSNPDSLCTYPLYDIAFVNDSIGYITGGNNVYENSNTHGVIYKTIDRGISWQLTNTYSDGLTKLDFPSDSIGYTVSMGGIILKLNSANNITTPVNAITHLKKTFSVFPNPASATITINFNEIKNIFILNLLGEKVMERCFSTNNTGNIELDISLLSSGIYFLKSGGETIKFVKQ